MSENFKPVEVDREGKAFRLAEDLVEAALCLLGYSGRWIQKRVNLTTRTDCERTFEFHIQLTGTAVVATCMVNGLEDDSEKDPVGDKTNWRSGELEIKTPVIEQKFQGWLLSSGAIYIEPIKRIFWGELANGRFEVQPDPEQFPFKEAMDPDGAMPDDASGHGSNLDEALGYLVRQYGSYLGLELVETKWKEN